MNGVLDWGVEVVRALQAHRSHLADLFNLAVTQLGHQLALVLLVAFVIWCVDRRLGLRLGALLVGSGVVNVLCKAWWRGPRPYQFARSVALIGPPELSPGVPSGHAQLTLTAWGTLARGLKQRWAVAVAALVVLLVAGSRLYLGAHFPHDVLVGLALGATLLVLAPHLERWLVERFQRLSPRGQLVAGGAPSLLLPLWPHRDLVALGGVLAGLCAGLRYAPVEESSPKRRGPGWTAASFAAGALALVALYLALGWLARRTAASGQPEDWYPAPPSLALALGLALRWLRYGVTGLWIAGGWPALAPRLGLPVVGTRPPSGQPTPQPWPQPPADADRS